MKPGEGWKIVMPATESLLLQAGYALLIAAMLVPRLEALRILVALFALVGIVRAAFWSNDWTSAAWLAALLLVCIILLARPWLQGDSARFAPEERGMLTSLLVGVSRTSARHLIDQGMWLTGKAGDVLTREGESVDHLYYLAEGEARVMSMGRQVGTCRAGDLVGELTVLSGEPASATVILSTSARFWCASAEALKPYVDTHEDIRQAIDHGFAAALKAKLRASNRTIAEAGGVKAGAA